MEKSLVIYGPQGCGKTQNAEKLRKRYGLREVVDGWEPGQPTRISGVLYLTNVEFGRIGAGLTHFPDVIPFSEAIKE
jgi:hypothetical protein